MATHSSILAWRISWTEEPGGLWHTGLLRVRHDWGALACIHGMTNNVEHLLVHLLAICISYLLLCCSLSKLRPHGLQHARFPCPPLSPGVRSSSRLLSQCWYLTSHPLLSSSPFAFSRFQHQGLVRSYLEKCLFKFFVHCYKWIFVFTFEQLTF